MFQHDSALGNAHADKLFDRVKVWRKRPEADADDADARHAIGSIELDNWGPARSFADYAVTVSEDSLPAGVTIVRH